jgi:aspartyl-tRNA synthetase
MTDSPTRVDFKQLRELYVQSTWKEKKEGTQAPETGVATPAS